MSDDPKRIKLSRAKGWRMPENTIKVDRSSCYGNPFPVTKGTKTKMGVTSPVWQVGTWGGPAMWFKDTEDDARKMAIDAFAAWIALPQQAQLLAKAKAELRGKNLACWCKAGDCHADVWLRLVNSTDEAPA